MTINRETWLSHAVEALKSLFAEAGVPIQEAVRVSCGFASTGLKSHHVGECWARKNSADSSNHIFISPILDDAVEVLDTLVHELVHAVDNCAHKHGKEFKKIALKLGLEGPMRSTSAGPKLKARLQELSIALGPYPHAKLMIERRVRVSKPRPQARCPECDYQVPMLKKFLEWGPPLCPEHKVTMLPIGDWGDTELTLDLAFGAEA